MKSIPVIIIADTGIDDAVAIIASLFSKNLDVQGIVAASGNMDIAQITKNTLSILQFVGKEVPVYVGVSQPLSQTNFSVTGFHGDDGIGGYVFPALKLKAKPLKDFYEYLLTVKGKVNIINIAPLTNLAILLKEYPNSKEKIDRVIIQGGVLEKDTTYPSFNIATDPVACELVLSSGVDIVVCPSDMGHNAFLDKQDVKEIQSLGKVGEMLEFTFRSYRDRVVQNNVATHDSCAVAYLSQPDLFHCQRARVWVRYLAENNFGVLDFDFDSPNTNALVCLDINIDGFKKFLMDCIKKSNEFI